MTKADNTTRPVNFIRFHGLTLLVVENGGVEYIEVKALSDLVGLDWRGTRRTVTSQDNTVLYGTRVFNAPEIAGLGGLKSPRDGVEMPPTDDLGVASCPETSDSTPSEMGAGGLKPSQTGLLFIRLDRSRMYLARINTDRVRSNGNVSAAEMLLALQIEWAEALHAYETNGVAVKKGQREDQTLLMGLIKAREVARPAEQRQFTRMIGDLMERMGYPVEPDSQQSLPLGQ